MRKTGNRIAVLAAGLVTMSASSAVFAVQLDAIQGNLSPTMLFDKSLGANGQIDVSTGISGANAIDAGGTIILDLGTLADIASFEWSGNDLTSDNSVGGAASGTFGGGGTLTITGTLYDFGVIPGFTGVLMQGTVSGFSAEEPNGGDNFLDTGSSAIFTPLSGALVDGTQALVMNTDYVFAFTGGIAQQNGGDLQDFGSSIQNIASFQWTMTPVPEPSTLLLASSMALGIMLRRRKS
ncbi:MAG: PEP-CTERM sorting domain-containing protein [Planctomycetes bacterium]|nr:PEP-CTERM sorting domain-containing protein [Planctomycetota bacterium]